MIVFKPIYIFYVQEGMFEKKSDIAKCNVDDVHELYPPFSCNLMTKIKISRYIVW